MYKYNSKFDMFLFLLPLELHGRRQFHPLSVSGNLYGRTTILLEGIDAVLGVVG